MSPIKIIFFGTPDAARYALEELLRARIIPNMVVTAPDKPKGRGLTLASTPVKIFAEKKGIPVFQPEKIDDSIIATIERESPDLFVVAAYGKLFPEALLAIPRLGTLNIHPSLLPKYRGASPVRDVILSGDSETGVTIILLDAEMDHGPIVAQQRVDIRDLPKARVLEEKLFRMGGQMIATILPDLIKSKIKPTPQDHSEATFTHKWKKEDGRIDVHGEPLAMLRKIRASDGWPGAYFFVKKDGRDMRINIVDAHVADNALIVDRVIPEGKREMSYADFLRGFARA